MIKIVLLIIFYILGSTLEVIKLYREKKKKELFLYSSMLSLSLVINLMLLYGFDYISLAKLINIILGLD